MIKKALFAVLMGLIALATPCVHAQSANELMPMVAQQMNQGLKASDPVTKVEWNPASSSLIMYLNQNLIAEAGIDASSFNTPEARKLIKDAMFENASDAADMAEVLTTLEQLGVKLIIRIPLKNGHTDIPLSSADFE